jgi:heme exporter protein A
VQVSAPDARPAAGEPRGAAAAVEAEGLCRRYGRRWALVDITVRLPRGSALLLAGRNGSGKSTLLRVLATAIRPDRGRGRVGGFDLVRERDEVRRRTALLAHPAYTYESLTALENLQVAARFLGRDAAARDLHAILEEVGLAERAADAVETFSAGMRKRLAQYGQLDPPGFRFVDRLFERLRERGTTVILATHLLERGADLCDEGLVLEAGRVAWTGSAPDLPARGVLAASGLAEGGGAWQ